MLLLQKNITLCVVVTNTGGYKDGDGTDICIQIA